MLTWDQVSSIAPLRYERAWIEIDVSALSHNVRQLRRWLAPQVDLMAIVKADAYGHGALTVAEVACREGASWLGVATIPEGIELREAGIQVPILLLGATNTPEQVGAIAHWRLQPTLCTPKQALIFAETLKTLKDITLPLPVHLKLDTGMSRLGVPWDQALELVQLIQRLPQLKLVGIYSHLATADDPDPTIMGQQHHRFRQAIIQVKQAGISLPRLHLANSAATLGYPELHYDLVRVGLCLYGYYPAPHFQSVVSLQPVLQLKARVTQVKIIAPGTGVSYSYQFIASQEMHLAVVGIGYAGGVPRQLSNRMVALIRGQLVAQVGAVTMDQLMFDVSNVPGVQPGDVVTLLGRDGDQYITAEHWAVTLGTIVWEIICAFKHRLPRNWV